MGLGRTTKPMRAIHFRTGSGTAGSLSSEAMRELSKFAEDHGVALAMQNHGPDVVTCYQDVLRMIDEVGSPAF